jgi:hypothetical protein
MKQVAFADRSQGHIHDVTGRVFIPRVARSDALKDEHSSTQSGNLLRGKPCMSML